MELRIQRVTFPKGRRVVAVSDIHGWYDMLKGLLTKINFSGDDILVLVGDTFEKGQQNLKLLRYLMELSKTHDVYKILGNCDIIYEDIFEEFTREKAQSLYKYRIRPERSEGIMHQMAREVGMEASDPDLDLEELRRRLKEQLPDEVEFLKNWVHILDTEHLLFGHGGLTSPNIEEQENWSVRKNDRFMDKGIKPPKMCVVGHFPTENYPSEGKFDLNPRLSWEKNICSIDGGCVVMSDRGQLNALVLPDGDAKNAWWTSFDLLPEVTVLDAQEANIPHSVLWGEGYQWVEKLDEKDEFTLCRQELTGDELWILTEKLYTGSDGKLSSSCCTDYMLPLQPGDKVKLLQETSRGYLVKKDGIIGWYRGRIEK